MKNIIRLLLIITVSLSTSANADFLNRVGADAVGAGFMGLNSGIDSFLGLSPSDPQNTQNTFKNMECFQGRSEFCYQNSGGYPQQYYPQQYYNQNFQGYPPRMY